jgi:hypothetical protein
MNEDPETEILRLAREIQLKTKLDFMQAVMLAEFIYRKEHPGFNDEMLV